MVNFYYSNVLKTDSCISYYYICYTTVNHVISIVNIGFFNFISLLEERTISARGAGS